MDAIEKAIADFVQASAGSRLQAAMRAADQGRTRDETQASSTTGEEDGIGPSPKPEPGSDTLYFDLEPTPTSGNAIMVNPTDLATTINDPRAETATNFTRPTFPKAPAPSQLALSLKLKARAMRAVLLALNEGHTPWDEFSAEHVRAYEAICDQLNVCLQTKRRDRVS
jgi:hypothetical protein